MITPQVLIIGAGPVGLTLACELRRRGTRCRIIDAGHGPTPACESRALGIHARTLEVLEASGVTAELVERGLQMRALNAWDHGRCFARLQLDFSRLPTTYPFVLVLPQGETEQCLINNLQQYGTAVEWDSKLVHLHADATAVHAVIRRADDSDEELRVQYLAGCDGARSTVRKALKLPFRGHGYDEQFLLADVCLDWDLQHNEAHILLTPTGPVPAVPLPRPGNWRLIGRAGEEGADTRDAIMNSFRKWLTEAGMEGITIGDPSWTSAFRIHRRAVNRLRIGRCFLAGDAAHIHSPVGGQGMNLGICEAGNLASKLTTVISGAASDSLLDSYEAERLPIARATLRGTHLATRIVMLKNPFARALRNRMASYVLDRPVVRQRLTAQLSGLGNLDRPQHQVSTAD